MKIGTSIASLLALVLLFVVLGPLFTIWSLNTLFPTLAIPYNVETWCAVILLAGMIRSNVTVRKE